MKTKITIAVVVLFLAGVLFVIVRGASSGSQDSKEQVPSTVMDKQSASSTSLLSLADIQKHSDASSCWSAINGGVYDLTSWISGHPGGQQAILGICGKDGSEAFNGQHGGKQKQADTLATFKIGELSQ